MIVPATLEDAPAIAVLEDAAMGHEAWSSAQVREELAAAADGSRVVRILPFSDADTDAAGEAIGWCDLAVGGEGADTADLLRVAVHPAARRRGHAAALLAASTDALPAHVERVLLEVADGNDAARALYGRHGYAEIARRARYYRDGSDAVVMQRVLDRRRDRGEETA